MLVIVAQFSVLLSQEYNYFGFPTMINIEKCLFNPANNLLHFKHSLSINASSQST